MPGKRGVIGLPEVMALGGLVSLGYGLWLYSPAAMYCVVGAVVMMAGVLLGRRA